MPAKRRRMAPLKLRPVLRWEQTDLFKEIKGKEVVVV